ncbi:MAG: hypothetical protein EPN47_16390 [Acidobacteria bacterium]|nr:MAG: hypothetical protein EPN47_16390 [Acidobacteriota bacterium]
MRKKKYMVAILAAMSLLAIAMPSAWAKKRHESVSPDDPTYKLYQLLNDSYGGKLTDYYLLANLYPDPQAPSSQLQRVICVDYDKARFFGRLRIYVRSVGQLTPDQMKTYDAKQVYDFGESDDTKYEKIDPGELGGTGDLYLKASADGPLVTAPITDEARQDYDMLITKYLLPALQKK